MCCYKNPKSKARKQRSKPQFFNAYYELGGYGTLGTNDATFNPLLENEQAITNYIEKTNKITGDILFVGTGTDYVTRPEYGVVVVDLSKKAFYLRKKAFYGYSPRFNPKYYVDDSLIFTFYRSYTLSIILVYPQTTAEAILQWLKFLHDVYET